MKLFILRTGISLLSLVFAGSNLWSASFNVSNTVSGQTIGNNETGVVASTGKISVSGSTVAVTFNGAGDSHTLTNNGTIEQLGSGRALRSNTAGLTMVITNNATGIIQSTGDDTFQVSATAANNNVTLYNYGIIRNNGIDAGQAIDWANMTGSNVLHNYSGASITTTGADAVRPGANGTVNNAGTISATPYKESTGKVSGSDGVDVQLANGVTVNNTGSGLISGRHGITGGDETAATGVTISVTNEANATIRGVNGSGINIDYRTSHATIVNSGTIEGLYDPTYTDGDGDGVDVDGTVHLTNNGIIRGLGAGGLNDGSPNNSEGVSIGGGTVINKTGATISGENTNGTVGRYGNGLLVDNSDGGAAWAATTVTNAGTIRGYSGFAIKMIGSFNDSITNEVGGTIRGGTLTAVQTGDGNDTVTNRGAIIGDSGSAIDLEGGDDTLEIEGDSASITGNVSGGTGNNTVILNPGTGHAFAYAGSFSNFSAVEVQSGTVTFTGIHAYEGTTRVAAGTLILEGADRLNPNSSLEIANGTVVFDTGVTLDEQVFSELNITGDAIIDLGNTVSLSFGNLEASTGNISLSILGFNTGASAYALRFAGDWTSDVSFLTLLGQTMINGSAATMEFADGYTVMTVPEPSTALFLIVGLGLLLCTRHRHARES